MTIENAWRTIKSDTICSLPFALHAMPQCNWREVTPVTIGGIVTLPIGVLALLWFDPLSLRWFIAGLVLVALVALVAGWRYHGRPPLPASLGGRPCVGCFVRF